MPDRVLLVDDDSSVGEGLRRSLRGRYDLITAGSGAQGLALQREALESGEPFAVIVSDLRMPEMDGSQFLAAARAADRDVMLIVLSGQADLPSAIAVVNDAEPFRFLTKPCPTDRIAGALEAAVHHYRAAAAERDVLHRTLTEAVGTLAQVLSLAAPVAFNRTRKIVTLTERMACSLGISDWRLAVAAQLSQVGCVALPAHVLESVEGGEALEESEQAMYERHPATGRGLLEHIPRLEPVAEWIARQPLTADAPVEPQFEQAEVVFRAATAFLAAFEQTRNVLRAVGMLEALGGYPPAMIEALRGCGGAIVPAGVVREVGVSSLKIGMVLDQDVATVTEMVLVRKGTRVSRALVERLHNFCETVGVVEPIRVIEGAA